MADCGIAVLAGFLFGVLCGFIFRDKTDMQACDVFINTCHPPEERPVPPLAPGVHVRHEQDGSVTISPEYNKHLKEVRAKID